MNASLVKCPRMVKVAALFLAPLLCLFAKWLFNLLARGKVEKARIDKRKIVYRTFKGSSSQLQKEQRLYTRRVRSLWRKEMRIWPTFRITYPHYPSHAVFGVVVPESFELDHDCLDELGFSPGWLAETSALRYVLRVWFDCNLFSKIRLYRARRAFERFIGSRNFAPSFAEFRTSRRTEYLVVDESAAGFWRAPGEDAATEQTF